MWNGSPQLVKLVAVPRRPEPPADPIRFEQAIAAFRARVPMTDAAFQALADRSHTRAFTIAGATKLDLVNEVWQALDKAVADGTTFADFKKAVGEKLERDWGRKNPARVEQIFRTNVQRAYGAGTVSMLREPAVLKRRPLWKFSAIEDARTTPTCQSCDGTVLPADDPWWATHQPPLHFGCRSHVIGLTRAQAGDSISSIGPKADPQDGFGNFDEDWKPDLSKYPAELAAAYRAKVAAVPAPTPAEPPKPAVRDAFDKIAPKITKAAKRALEAIDEVHSDGVLPKISVETSPGRGSLGAYQFTAGGKALGISVKPTVEWPELTMVHEVGHFLDHQAIGIPGQFASTSGRPEMDALRNAIRGSKGVRQLRELLLKPVIEVEENGLKSKIVVPGRYIRYLLQDDELFARSYAQYIAIKSEDDLLLKGLGDALKSRVPRQWETQDFAPIADEFDRLFEKLGWLKKKPSK